MTTVNEAYITTAWQGALADFDQAAGPGHINDPFRDLACRLLELAHVPGSPYTEADAEHDACNRARMLGHAENSITGTWRWAERHMAGKAAVIPTPAHANGRTVAPGYADLAAYAASRGVPVEVFEHAGWSDAELYEYTYTDKQGQQQRALTDQERLTYERIRRAVRFETDAGPRYRLIDEAKPAPKYWHAYGSHTDATKAWYRFAEALAQAMQRGYLVLVNGEASVTVAQYWGVPALCETGGGEKLTPPQLLQVLKVAYPAGTILIALDCDKKGRDAALKKAAQYRAAGYDVRALDLGLGTSDDIADFCRLHQHQAAAQLLLCADLPDPQQTSATPASVAVITPSQAIIDELARLGYRFRHNLVKQKIEVNGRDLDDDLMHEIRNTLRDRGRKQFGAVEDAIATYAKRDSYHPIQDYLTGLRWDGRSRIAELAACLHSSDPPVTYEDGTSRLLTDVYLHRFLIGAVAKALDYRQQAMLVLLGPQRLGKSTLARWLCPPSLRAYYIEEQIDPKDKDSRVRLFSKFLWEVSELDGTTRKADVAQLKQFVSQETVTVRRAYARFDTELPALASLIGTVNNDSFLVDETGNRRFYVLGLTHIDRAYQQIDQDQVWAEAVAGYRAGEPWELLPEEQAHQAERNRAYYAETPLHDYVRRHFFVTRDPSHRMTAAEIVDTLRDRQANVNLTDHQIAIQLNRVAASLGLERVRDAAGRFYVGIMPKISP